MKYTLVAKTYILANIIGSIFMLFGHGNRRVWVYLFQIKTNTLKKCWVIFYTYTPSDAIGVNFLCARTNCLGLLLTRRYF